MERYRLRRTPPNAGAYMEPAADGRWYEAVCVDARISALEAQVKALTAERDAQAEAVRVLGEELASWRSAPYRSDILETYWADISDTDKHVIRFGLDVNNNPIASKAVKDGE